MLPKSVLGYKPFLDRIREFGQFKMYHESRPDAKRKQKIDLQISSASPQFGERVKLAIRWFEPIEFASKLLSSNKTPMSACPVIVQALRNEINKVLNNSVGPHFDSVFDDGSRNHLANFVRLRFNMDGVSPPRTTKVGLLSPRAIWAFVLDPYKGELPHSLFVGTDEKGLAYQQAQMLEFLVPYVQDSAEHRGEIDERRKSLRQDFLEYLSQQEPWKDVFQRPNISLNMSAQQLNDQVKLTLQMVSDWIK
jgi:hypothetical protein